MWEKIKAGLIIFAKDFVIFLYDSLKVAMGLFIFLAVLKLVGAL